MYLDRKHISNQEHEPLPTGFTHQEPGSPSLRLTVTDYGKKGIEALLCYQAEPLNWGKGKKPGERKAKTREEMKPEALQASQQRAKKNVKEKVIMLGADRMFTFTFRENVTDIDQAWEIWKDFQRRLKRGIPQKFEYVVVPEKQKRGAIHFHAAVKGYYNTVVLDHHWNQAIKSVLNVQGEIVGNVDFSHQKYKQFKNSKNRLAIGLYLTKYMTKDDLTGINRKRYSASDNIPKPGKEVIFLPPGAGTKIMVMKMLKDRYGYGTSYNDINGTRGQVTYFTSAPRPSRQVTEEMFYDYDPLIDVDESYQADEPPF